MLQQIKPRVSFLMGSEIRCSTKQSLSVTKKLISVFKCDACLVCGCLELAHSNSLTFYLYNAGCLEEHKVLQALGVKAENIG